LESSAAEGETGSEGGEAGGMARSSVSAAENSV
jgi:hypothetical protein